MKQRDLINRLRKIAAADGSELIFVRHGKHDIYRIGSGPADIAVPRHSDIDENTARSILRAATRGAE